MKTKSRLRQVYRAKRAALTLDEVQEKSIAIANQLLRLDIWNHANYHLFLPIEKSNEVDTAHILNILQGRDKNVILSRSNFNDGTMQHYLLTDSTKLVVNKYGIPEPDENAIEFPVDKINVVFIPLLVADLNGHRVGYGKGFYDRFLINCQPNTQFIGLSFFEPIESIEDIYTGDVPVNQLITPANTFNF
ncbi:5-formyltetrahydrofolate cyclo-ligase [Nonlabens ponticola]|uniref:5-formyltetrahydrofolate cyclo-ligase n=1 Tax=Nonlabens ponticola TaxID=2496866 RepID=A0A3S9MWF6_9FLAO|nr:5-formyltetrahydrofolate cyclo-ligase [Nonlabens ponticola]AZQ43467.1 5-formyltetrahydrofolate cyclo-ligase [Nonlabens ponticola]